MKDITVESLFYSGGTIDKKSIIKTKSGNFAINDNYIFFANKENFKAVKYEYNFEYSYKLLKTKIKIITPERFINFMTDDLFSIFRDKIFNYYLN